MATSKAEPFRGTLSEYYAALRKELYPEGEDLWKQASWWKRMKAERAISSPTTPNSGGSTPNLSK